MIRPALTILLVFLLCSVVLLPAASDDGNAASSLRVVVSIMPQAYIVKRIGGDQVSVTTLVGPGQSHETYEPTPRQMADLSGAAVYFIVGINFENSFVQKARKAIASLNVVDTRAGIKLRRMAEGDDDHEKGSPDPHIWMDPLLVKTQSETVANELKRLDPAHAAVYDANLKLLTADLDSLEAHMRILLMPFQGERFFVFHPAFGYLADRYGLIQESIEAEGKEPGGQQLAAVIEKARANNVRTIFVQPQFAAKTAEAVAHELGVRLLPLDPLPRDYVEDMMTLARTLAEGLTVSNSTRMGK
jgi:zinc transport system substrate-binding protein